MPQVYMIIGPSIQQDFVLGRLSDLGLKLVKMVEKFFDIEGRNDVAFTAVSALCVRNEHEVQIEVRYTAGEDEYDWGVPFDPSVETQEKLAEEIKGVFSAYFEGRQFFREPSLSVWTKPYYKGSFKNWGIPVP